MIGKAKFDKEIGPLIKKIHIKCTKRGVPFTMVFLMDQDENGPTLAVSDNLSDLKGRR